MNDEPRDGDAFAQFCRPKLAALLGSLKLDVTYERALGNNLFRRTKVAASKANCAPLNSFDEAKKSCSGEQPEQLLFYNTLPHLEFDI